MKSKEWKEFELTRRTPENEKYFKVNTLISTTSVGIIEQAEKPNTITNPNNNQIIIHFTNFTLESHSSCGYDYLEIR